MSDKMTPITFKELLNQAIKEYKREKNFWNTEENYKEKKLYIMYQYQKKELKVQ